MKIYENDTHEAKYLYVENGERFNALEGHLIENIDSHYILRLSAPVTEEGIFRFDVTSCETFSAWLVNRKLSRPEMVSILAQLKSVITTLEDHMLSDANILLSPEHMYIDRSSRKVRFVPVCGCGESFSERLRRLTEALFLHADLEETESLRLAAQMMKTSLKEDVRLYDLMYLVETRRVETSAAGTGMAGTDAAGRPAAAEEQSVSGRQSERYQGSSIVRIRPQEERTMRLTGEDRNTGGRLLPEAGDEEETEEEKPGGIRGLFQSITRGLRDRMDESDF